MEQRQKHQILEQETDPESLNILDHSIRAGMLNEMLRKQLSPTLATPQINPINVSQQEKSCDLLSSAIAAIDELLNNCLFERELVHSKLSKLFHHQKNIYEQTPIDDRLRQRQYITHCGLVMSPDNCITTQLDDIRVRAFVRGIHAAVQQKRANHQGAIHVVYPACGPFAPLLMPLLGYYCDQGIMSADELQITLIDMQPGATQSLEALVEEMGVTKYIKKICCMDATQYHPQQDTVDIVILEAMQHGFSREGQLSIARHFSSLLSPQGHFIPEKIVISAHLTNLQKEFVQQWQGATVLAESEMNQTIKQQRIYLGDILTVTAQSLRAMKEIVLDENTTLLECETVQIPNLLSDDEQTLIVCTRIQTWGDEWIGEYDSGISHPLPDQNVCINFRPQDERPGDLLLKSGDGLKFYYRLNGLPGFMPTWVEGLTVNE